MIHDSRFNFIIRNQSPVPERVNYGKSLQNLAYTFPKFWFLQFDELLVVSENNSAKLETKKQAKHYNCSASKIEKEAVKSCAPWKESYNVKVSLELLQLGFTNLRL